jgi:hypothetical protein
MPPGPVTGQTTEGCYMNWTRNCFSGLTREHFVSESVLTLIGDKYVSVTGAPWLPPG